MTRGFAKGVAQGHFFVGRSDMGPKWTCATSAFWEVETPTPLILGRPTWPLLPSGLPSPPWLQTSMGIAPPMLHHGSHGVASKLFAPKGRTPWASTPAESLHEGKKAAHPCVQG